MRKLDEETTASTADIRAVIPPERTQSSGLNLPTMLLGALCVLLAIIAIILAAVSMNRQNVFNLGPAQAATGGGNDGQAAGKTWLIMIGHDYGAHEYIDVEGNLAGYHHDLIREVCEAAGLNCRTVWDSYPNCWDSQAGQHGRGGQGLMNGWYDACTGWSRTRLRDGTFSFSKAFLPTHTASFYVRTGNPGNFNVDDVSGKKIVFLDGWVDDEKCLARQKSITGSVLPADKIVHVTDTDKFVEQINTGLADAGWAANTLIAQGYFNDTVLQLLPPTTPQNCMLDGSAMMTRKDNNFITYWNQGFDKLVESGRFTRLCSEAARRYGRVGTVACLNP
ncbi:Hypp5545 [Branchiostoma lanceolatum]|uniref:Hypp5545 protein n=1 Tax=Branchiostoma lanceolatum TaxID=7740 RepID=A0A8J9YR43_BRALA|nr:Hypp5545 [Branchiostoma lanceolatum]